MQRATTPRESRNTQARTVSRRWWCDAEPLLEVALADDGNPTVFDPAACVLGGVPQRPETKIKNRRPEKAGQRYSCLTASVAMLNVALSAKGKCCGTPAALPPTAQPPDSQGREACL